MSKPADLPLAGLRVVDLTSVLFGPYTTQLLGDLGADIIKVEAPEGDVTRAIGPTRNPGMAAAFLGCNRDKPSIEVPDCGLRFDRQALPVRHHQPRTGEQGAAILREAGLDEAAIRAALGG